MIQLICLKSLLFNESIFFPSCVGVHWPCLAQRINISYQFVQGETFEAKPNDVFEKYLFYLFTNSFYHCIRYKAYLVSIIYLSDNMNRTISILLLFLKICNTLCDFIEIPHPVLLLSTFLLWITSFSSKYFHFFEAYQKHVYPPYAVVISSSIGRRPFQLFEKIAAGSLFWRWYVRLFLPLLSCSQSSSIYMKLFSNE